MQNQFDSQTDKSNSSQNLNKWGSEDASNKKLGPKSNLTGSSKESSRDSGGAMNTMQNAFENIKHQGADLEKKVEAKVTSFIGEASTSASLYAKKAVKWVKANPKASTAIAIVAGVAVGSLIKSALSHRNDE